MGVFAVISPSLLLQPRQLSARRDGGGHVSLLLSRFVTIFILLTSTVLDSDGLDA